MRATHVEDKGNYSILMSTFGSTNGMGSKDAPGWSSITGLLENFLPKSNEFTHRPGDSILVNHRGKSIVAPVVRPGGGYLRSGSRDATSADTLKYLK
jgi:hypothetical protein